MRHAYLIMAHNEFVHLQQLIDALDDERNDIYVHIDSKVKQLPKLYSKKASLYVLENRVDVRWGHVSQIKAEYTLLNAAYQNGKYDYYHIISGAHYPLVSLDEIDRYFSTTFPASVLMPMDVSEDEIKMRIGYRNFFMRNLVSHNKFIFKWHHILWRAALYPQKKLDISRDISFTDGKASQWCSLTHNAVKAILDKEKVLTKRFKRTFCSDEFFIPAALKSTSLPIVYTDKLTYLSFYYGNAAKLTEKDYETIKASRCLFGRKFTSESLSLIKRIDSEK